MAEDSLDFIFKRLVAAMDFRSLDADELFSLADLDEDEAVTVGELISLFERLNLGLSRKELTLIRGVLESGGQSALSREEFVLLMERLKLGLRKAKPTVVLPVLSSQSLQPTVRKSHKMIGKAGAEQALTLLVHAMESQGVSIMEVLDTLEISKKEKVTLSGLSNALANTFPHVASEDIMRLISYLEFDKNYEINAFEVFEFLAAYSKLITFSLKATFRNLAKFIQEKDLDTNAFFILHNIRETMPLGTFVMRICTLFEIPQEQAIAIFTSIDTDKRGVVDPGQLIAVIDSYRTDEPKENWFMVEGQCSTEAMGGNKAVNLKPSDFVRILGEYKLTPQHVFQLADPKNAGRVPVAEVKKSVLKLIPLFPAEDLTSFLKMIPRNEVSLDEFLRLFPLIEDKPRPKLPHEDPLELDTKDCNGLRPDQVYWIKKMDDAALLNSIALNTLFTAADMNKDDSVGLAELGGMLKKCIPQATMSHADVASVMAALDINGNGKIERQEFLTRIIQCRNSDLDPRLLTKYEREVLKIAKEGAKPPEKSPLPLRSNPVKVVSVEAQAPVVYDRHIKPLCIKASSLYSEEIGSLFGKLRASLSAEANNDLYINLPAESLFNIFRFKRLFCVGKGLTENECEVVFGLTDTHSRDSIYLYQLLTTLDSFENDFSTLPFPWNEKAEKNSRVLWSEVSKSVNGRTALHQAFGTSMRSFLSDDQWNSIIFGAQLPPQHKIMLRESLIGVKGLKVYHIAALLQAYLPLYILDVEQIVYEGLTVMKDDIAEVFAMRGYTPLDELPKEKLMVELCTVMELTAIESSLIVKSLYEEEKPKPLYYLLTYVDMIRSTLDQRGTAAYDIPNPPFATALYQEAGASELFRTIALAFKTSITDYGVQITDWLDEIGFVNLLNRAAGISPEDLHRGFHLLRFNKNPSVRAYHLVTLLDTYSAQRVVLSYPKAVLNKLYTRIPKTQTGITWVKSCTNGDFDTPLSRRDVEIMFQLALAESESLFIYIDSQNRGGVFLYQIATIVDLFISMGANVAGFPFSQNQGVSAKTKEIMNTIAVHLDEQGMSAYRYYANSGIDIEEACDKKLFARRLGSELSPAESSEVFDTLEMRRVGFVRMYHFVACLETFCKRKIPMEFTPGGL